MTIFLARTDLTGRRQCKRCHRMFHPTAEGQDYGSTCARKVAAQPEIIEQYGKVQKEVLA